MSLTKTDFQPFDWLDFEMLTNSDGYKFEIYPSNSNSSENLFSIFVKLFGRYSDELIIGQFADAEWGDYCIDTWDLENEKYDYSPVGKSAQTSRYLKLLSDNEIEPSYKGYCKTFDWDTVLPVFLECVLNHVANYSIMIYSPSNEFVFYFHHTNSVGVYYRDSNKAISDIVSSALDEGFQIENSNDERIISQLSR